MPMKIEPPRRGPHGRRWGAWVACAATGIVVVYALLASVLWSGKTPDRPQVEFDLATVDGARVSSASLHGERTVVWFWAPWCPYSEEIADAMAVEAARNGDRIKFVGIGAEDSVESMRHFVDTTGVGGFEHGIDATGEVLDRFGVTAFPAFAFLEPNGTIEVNSDGIRAPELRERIAAFAG